MVNSPARLPDFALLEWDAVERVGRLGSAFKKKNCWVIHSPRSSAVWYTVVLGNLMGRYLRAETATTESVRQQLIEGLERNAFERLKRIAEVPSGELASAIGIPLRTLARRERFNVDESERLLRVASAYQKTLELFEDLDKARHWFSSPKRVLAGKTPLEYCDTEIGAQEVEHLLGRIEHGVFS